MGFFSFLSKRREYDENVTQYSAKLLTAIDILQTRQPDGIYGDKEEAIKVVLEAFLSVSRSDKEKRVVNRLLAHYMESETGSSLLMSDSRLDFSRLRRFSSDLELLSTVVPLAEQDAEKEMLQEKRKRQEEVRRKKKEEKRRKREESHVRERRIISAKYYKNQEEEARRNIEDSQKAKPATGNEGVKKRWYPRSYCEEWCGYAYLVQFEHEGDI